jgi:hypothetical protein
MNIIANAGNPSYFETRALEYVEEAKLDRLMFRSKSGYDHSSYKQKLIRAIQMLTIAVLKVENGEF